MARMKKGSKEAKAWGKRMRAMRKGGKRKTYNPKKEHKGRGKSMAKRGKGKRSRGKHDKRVPLLPMVGLAYNFVRGTPRGPSILDDIKSGNLNDVLYDAKEIFTGMDNEGKFRFDWLLATYLPIVAGAVGSKIASATGVNRAMRRIPMVGKYIKL